jgi:hypothetical protein
VLDSMQKFSRGIVSGLAMPEGVPGPMKARITPPVQEKVKAPVAYVWGGTADASRQAGSRGPGFMKWPWTMSIWLVYMDTPTDAFENEPFPRVIDTVIWAFLKAPMMVFVSEQGQVVGPNQVNETDTQVQKIGERIRLQYPPERMVASQRQVWYTAQLLVDILEVVQA